MAKSRLHIASGTPKLLNVLNTCFTENKISYRTMYSRISRIPLYDPLFLSVLKSLRLVYFSCDLYYLLIFLRRVYMWQQFKSSIQDSWLVPLYIYFSSLIDPTLLKIHMQLCIVLLDMQVLQFLPLSCTFSSILLFFSFLLICGSISSNCN